MAEKTHKQTLGTLYDSVRNAYRQAGCAGPGHRARQLLDYLGIAAPGEALTYPDKVVSDAEINKVQDGLTRNLAGEPVSRISGHREFYGLDFLLSKETLDPRPETELIVDLVRKRFTDPDQALSILDLGTGTGCLLITLLTLYPESCGVAVDISEGALRTAYGNARCHHVEARMACVCGDWHQALTARFDVIVANPPYIAREVIPGLAESVRRFDPILALDGGKDGFMEYKKIFSGLERLFYPHSRAYFEIGYDQENGIMRLAEESRVASCKVHPDNGGNSRVAEIACGDK